jgi:hypothetical protein
MKLADHLKDFHLTKKATSPRADKIQQLADLIKVDFKVILHKTFDFTEEEILNIYLTARSWPKNPPALANLLIKRKREEIKQQLKKISTPKSC